MRLGLGSQRFIGGVTMSQQPEQGATAPPGPAPPAPAPPCGLDSQGNENPHSLLPRGWQRSGALAVLFDPATGPLQAGLQTPATLLSPDYGSADKTAGDRTHETIQALSDRLGLAIVSAYAEGDEPALPAAVVSQNSGVVLICWEHDHTPALASSLP